MNTISIKYQVKDKPGHYFKSVHDVYKVLKRYYNPLQEEFILLPTVGQEFTMETLFRGGLNSSIVDLKTLFRILLTKYPNTSAFIVAHNHPSGDVEPSEEDIRIRMAIQKAADLLSYTMHDFIIFSNKHCWSYANNGTILPNKIC